MSEYLCSFFPFFFLFLLALSPLRRVKVRYSLRCVAYLFFLLLFFFLQVESLEYFCRQDGSVIFVSALRWVSYRIVSYRIVSCRQLVFPCMRRVNVIDDFALLWFALLRFVFPTVSRVR